MSSQINEKDETIRLQKEILQCAIDKDPSIKEAFREIFNQ